MQGNDFPIPYGTSTTLYAASGGTGSYSYHWSPEALLVNPDLQNAQTVNLYSTAVFTLLVTNQTTLCQNSDEVVVTITGGPLSINPTAIPEYHLHWADLTIILKCRRWFRKLYLPMDK